MDYEKKYKNALAHARDIHRNEEKRKDMEFLFPELKGIDDEEIKEEIINYFECQSRDEPTRKDIHNKWIAWLEKQGEKPQGKTYTFEGKSVIEAINKIGEKKFADKVEPKFKVGDWIVNNEDESVGQITKIIHEVDDDGLYAYEHTNGYFHNAFEKDYHLWTIEDVKDGDVLCSEQIILLFKKWEYNSNWNCVIAYAGIDITGKLQITNKHWLISNYAHPATKEQRDILFAKMHEAGYEWDAEKKKLGKRVIDEGKAEMDYCFTKMMNGEKVSSAWSEEDEHRIKDIIYFLDTAKKHYASTVEIDACINWLNAIKTRRAWKPSDEQMASITCAVRKMRESACYDSELVSLFNDLNKLMEK